MENHHIKKISGMKSINLIRFFKLGLLSVAIALIGSSCVKSVDGRTDFDNLKPTVLIPEGGVGQFRFGRDPVSPTDDVDTSWFHLNYAATNVAAQDEVITIAIDDAALAAYNALGGTQYAKFPDSIYSFKTTISNRTKRSELFRRCSTGNVSF